MDRIQLISKQIDSLLLAWYEAVMKAEGEQEAKRRLSNLTLKYASDIDTKGVIKTLVEQQIQHYKKHHKTVENEKEMFRIYQQIEKLEIILMNLEEVDIIE